MLLCSFCKIKQQWIILLSLGSLEVVKGGSRIRLHCGVQFTGVRRRGGGSVWGVVPFSLPIVHFQVLRVTYGHVTTKLSCGAPLKERTAFPGQRDPKMVNSHPTDCALYCLLYPKSKLASAEMQIASMRKTYLWHSGNFKPLLGSAYQSLKGFDYRGWQQSDYGGWKWLLHGLGKW